MPATEKFETAAKSFSRTHLDGALKGDAKDVFPDRVARHRQNEKRHGQAGHVAHDTGPDLQIGVLVRGQVAGLRRVEVAAVAANRRHSARSRLYFNAIVAPTPEPKPPAIETQYQGQEREFTHGDSTRQIGSDRDWHF